MALHKGAVHRHLIDTFGGDFTTRENVVAVAITPAVLLRNNPERIGWVIINTGSVQITLRRNRAITAGEGLVAPAAGDTITSTVIEDGNFPTLELSAIAAGAGGEVLVLEFVRESDTNEV